MTPSEILTQIELVKSFIFSHLNQVLMDSGWTLVMYSFYNIGPINPR